MINRSEKINVATDNIIEMFEFNHWVNEPARDFIVGVSLVKAEVKKEHKCDQEFQKVEFGYDDEKAIVMRRRESSEEVVLTEVSDFKFSCEDVMELYVEFGEEAKSWRI